MKRIPALDGLRAVAAFVVFLSHVGFEKWVNGHLPVSLFFVLSGYLLASAFLREFDRTGSVDFKKFYKRRALRILPPLFICYSIIFAVNAFLDGPYPIKDALAVALLIPNYRGTLFGLDGVKGSEVLWSLGVEEHFYLLFPLLFLIVMRRSKAHFVGACVFLFAALAILRIFFCHESMLIPPLGDADAATILWGALLAVVAKPPKWSAVRVWLLVPGLVFVVAFSVRHALINRVGFVVMMAPTAIVFGEIVRLAAHHPDRGVFRWLGSKPLVFFGKRSYVFYLIHSFTYQTAQRCLPEWSQAVVGFLAAVVFSDILYRTVEAPLTRASASVTNFYSYCDPAVYSGADKTCNAFRSPGRSLTGPK